MVHKLEVDKKRSTRRIVLCKGSMFSSGRKVGLVFLLSWLVLYVTATVVVLAAEDNDQVCDSSVDSPETCVSPDSAGAADWGVPQDLSNPMARELFETTTKQYMEEVLLSDPAYQRVRSKAVFAHESCTYWASIGECQNNPKYMLLQCCPACQSCDQLDWNLRCPFDVDELIWNQTGQVNALFTRLVADYNAQVLSRDPWVVIIDDFMTLEETQRLIELGAEQGYVRSMDAGDIQEDGTMGSVLSLDRTSENAWCLDSCFEDPVTQSVLDRLETMLDIPRAHFEYFQLLKYEVGEFYRQHNDYNPTELTRPQGNRILTAYAYLSDVPKGGGTGFPVIDLEIAPKRGRLVIWPSVLDSNPTRKDRKTDHEALPVDEGTKYGANIWVHQRDFAKTFAKDCV